MCLFNLLHPVVEFSVRRTVISHRIFLVEQEETYLLAFISHEEIWRMRENLRIDTVSITLLSIMDGLQICFDEAFSEGLHHSWLQWIILGSI